MQEVETRDLKVRAGRIKSNFLRVLMHILPMVVHLFHCDKPRETLGGQGRRQMRDQAMPGAQFTHG